MPRVGEVFNEMPVDLPPYKPPFPWFGGKSRAASIVWERFGAVPNYVEPFFGSGAVLFLRPHAPGIETINDKDGFVANFWRAAKCDPKAVAEHADNPVNENDLHARHIWLVEHRDEMTRRIEGDPDYFDAKIAGWWAWGLCCWIGSGWCSGKGPWGITKDAEGYRQLVHLGNAGRGVNRQLVHLGNAGCGVNRQLVHLGDAGRGVNRQRAELLGTFAAISERLRNVRVCCGDWKRVCGPTPTFKHGLTGVFLDPPYLTSTGRCDDLYRIESGTLANDVREWAIEMGKRPDMRIALCGYDGEHDMPEWELVEGKATTGGYGNQTNDEEGNVNKDRERIWFSPACYNAVQVGRRRRELEEQRRRMELLGMPVALGASRNGKGQH